MMQIRRRDTEGLLHLLYYSYLDFSNSVLFFLLSFKGLLLQMLSNVFNSVEEHSGHDTVQ